jgi:hypothetical protein
MHQLVSIRNTDGMKTVCGNWLFRWNKFYVCQLFCVVPLNRKYSTEIVFKTPLFNTIFHLETLNCGITNLKHRAVLFTSAHLDIQRVPAAIAREQAGFSISRSEPSCTRKKHPKRSPQNPNQSSAIQNNQPFKKSANRK